MQATFQNKKNYFLIKCFFNKAPPYILYFKDKTLLLQIKPYYVKSVHRVKKRLFADVLQNSCSWKFCKIYWKSPVFQSLFDKFTGIRRVHLEVATKSVLLKKVFLKILQYSQENICECYEILRTSILMNIYQRLLSSFPIKCFFWATLKIKQHFSQNKLVN